MPYSITNCKADLSGVLHGTTLNQITGLNNLFDRAARQLLLDLDPQETKRIVPLANQIFYQVYDYACPTDLKGNKVIDIRPQTPRRINEIWNQDYNQQFDVSKTNSNANQFTINFNTAIKTIRVDAPLLPQGTIVNQISGYTDNGTFNVGGGASSITTNNTNFINFGGSVQFNLDAGQASGYIENSTMETQNLSDQLNQGVEFLYVYLPSGTAVTAVELRWGSSSSDYYAKSVFVNQTGNAFNDGWNFLAFDWVSATSTGSPNASAIDYMRVTFTYNSTLQTGVLVNSYASRMGTILEIEYYSKYLFRDSITGAFKEKVTSDNDQINLDTETYNLFFYQVAFLAFQQQASRSATNFDLPFTQKGYEENVQKYKLMYKSEVQKPKQQYYQKPNPSYTRIVNTFRT